MESKFTSEDYEKRVAMKAFEPLESDLVRALKAGNTWFQTESSWFLSDIQLGINLYLMQRDTKTTKIRAVVSELAHDSEDEDILEEGFHRFGIYLHIEKE